jgi:hypothetical protein
MLISVCSAVGQQEQGEGTEGAWAGVPRHPNRWPPSRGSGDPPWAEGYVRQVAVARATWAPPSRIGSGREGQAQLSAPLRSSIPLPGGRSLPGKARARARVSQVRRPHFPRGWGGWGGGMGWGGGRAVQPRPRPWAAHKCAWRRGRTGSERRFQVAAGSARSRLRSLQRLARPARSELQPCFSGTRSPSTTTSTTPAATCGKAERIPRLGPTRPGRPCTPGRAPTLHLGFPRFGEGQTRPETPVGTDRTSDQSRVPAQETGRRV